MISLSILVMPWRVAGGLVVSSKTPRVSDKVLAEWQKDFFGTDEVWIFENYEKLFGSLKASGLHESLLVELMRNMRTSLTEKETVNISTFFLLNRINQILLVPAELKVQLPKDSLTEVYSKLLQTKRSPPFLRFSSRNEFDAFISKIEPRVAVHHEISKGLYQIGNEFYFFFTPDLWPILNAEFKMHLINQPMFSGDHLARRGLSVTLTFSLNDDLGEIAKKYSGFRDPKILEQALLLRARSIDTGSVSIPLAEVLQPFIAKHLNTFSEYSGPNCHNAGINSNKQKGFELRYVPNEVTLFDAIFRNHRFVKSNEKLQAGDLMVYFDANNSLVHSSTYITAHQKREIVFTKNSLSKYYPYIFQYRSDNEAVHFPGGKYKLAVFRPTQDPQFIISPEGYYMFTEKIVFFEDLFAVSRNLPTSLSGTQEHKTNAFSESSLRCRDLF